ncbi:ATP-dependent DNA helicase PIF7 [Octopus bimaculoides]|uniref:ATP-dependent DNA helicase PIF7 n=1 Tax=Octopus bimaculoides TaxID=37653 RepID=UPI00071D32D2|nr:ATP-dependent DNA helicase PIF7 [Octopus bimaculoides]|eukprot:XP_014781920.1 PREDICTED: ATP-dependent DNA helicase PIF7-like [Octopus bimaculoides]
MQKSIAIAVASSGIAATSLPGSRTAHSTFKLPINLTKSETPPCNISKNSDQDQVLKRCQLIVWDECIMTHKGAFDALYKTLQDIKGCEAPMGGITLLFSGDFRQTLPVISKGTRADEVQVCLKSSPLWRHVRSLTVTINMRDRLLGDQTSAYFASDILKLCDGKVLFDADGELDVHPFATPVSSLAELADKVFPHLKDNYLNHTWLSERAVLDPTNVTVTKHNDQLSQSLPSAPFAYKYVDTMVDAN